VSTSQVSTTYNFNLSVGDADGNGNAQYPIFTSDGGMTDEGAVAFANAFLALPWPDGFTARAWVTKHENDETQSEADLTTGTFS